MLVIRSKCMLEKQAEGLQRSTGALPVHGCASDWPCLSDTKQGFRRLLLLRRLMEFLRWLRVAQKSPRGAVQYPQCWNHARPKDSRCRANGAGKFPQSLRFVAVHPSLSSLSVLFSPFFPELRISVTSSFLVLFLLLFRNYMEGAEGGGRVVWGRERAREWGGGKRVAKKLCSFQPGALWKIWHPLLICSSKNPSGEGMLKEKKNQFTYRASVKNVGIKGCRST